MKKYTLLKITVLIVAMLSFNSCGSDSQKEDDSIDTINIDNGENLDDSIDTNDTIDINIEKNLDDSSDIDRKYYGKWRYVDNGEELLILSNTQLDFEVKNDDLLLITDGQERRSAMRASVANAKITGQIIVEDGASLSSAPLFRAYGGAGGLSVILRNVDDSSITTDTTTDTSGEFQDTSHPSGTSVEITIEENGKILKTEVPINSSEIDLGSFVLRDVNDYNFKVSLDTNEEFIYADGKAKSADINIKNIGNIEGTDVSYKIYYQDSEIARGISGTIFSNESKTIPITFNADTITTNVKALEFKVDMQDSNGRNWSDISYVNTHRLDFNINIRSAGSSIKGYIVLPNGNVKNINISGTGTITLPTIDSQYALILSNSVKSSSQNVYTIGINSDAPLVDENFIETGAHEPNNQKSEATTLGAGDTTTSYLGYGDIDYWLINSPAYNPDDSDSDGVLNDDDAFPNDPAASLDSDSDGYPDSWNSGKSASDSTTGLTTLDSDSDGDGVINENDAFPNDPAASQDSDANGYPESWNSGKTQSDSTTGLTLDTDFDNDGILNDADAFINDPSASQDSDGDGFPDSWNNAKTASDSTDNLILDSFPNDASASLDSDNDGFPDSWNIGKTQSDSTTGLTIDTDSDNDGVLDVDDAFPADVAASQDSDGDGTPDVWNSGYTQSDSTTGLTLDVDRDGDGVLNVDDAFQTDASASLDSDGDGLPDSWNSGKSASDSTTGLTLDTDSDGDGVLNTVDAFPSDPSASIDSDSDGYPDEWNSGKVQSDSTDNLRLDAFVNDPAASKDSDNDGLPDEWNSEKTSSNSTTGLTLDNDNDNDGVINEDDFYPLDETKWYNLTPIHNNITYGTVVSPYTNRVWLDRNIGATRVCTSHDDTECFGNYFQWGRNADGHEKLYSSTTSTQAVSLTQAGSSFITSANANDYDWAGDLDTDGSIRNESWSKTDGSSVCPINYRVPTTSEINVETLSEAYSSFLKLPAGGSIGYDNKYDVTNYTYGMIWIEGMSVNNYNFIKNFRYTRFNSGVYDDRRRAEALNVRCIKDY